MVRITSIDGEQVLRIRVEGRLAGRAVEDLRNRVLRHTPLGAIELDITDVEAVDTPGEELLIWLYRIGVLFRKGGMVSAPLFELLGIPTEDLQGPWPSEKQLK